MEQINESDLGLPAIIFEGEDAKQFDEYNKRIRTEREKDLLVEADKIYAEMCEKTNDE